MCFWTEHLYRLEYICGAVCAAHLHGSPIVCCMPHLLLFFTTQNDTSIEVRFIMSIDCLIISTENSQNDWFKVSFLDMAKQYLNPWNTTLVSLNWVLVWQHLVYKTRTCACEVWTVGAEYESGLTSSWTLLSSHFMNWSLYNSLSSRGQCPGGQKKTLNARAKELSLSLA